MNVRWVDADQMGKDIRAAAAWLKRLNEAFVLVVTHAGPTSQVEVNFSELLFWLHRWLMCTAILLGFGVLLRSQIAALTLMVTYRPR